MELLSLGKDPIRPEQPAGEDIRYDAGFEALQMEIDKMSSPSGPKSLDWEKVSRLSTDILGTKSKDLLVAGYFSVAQVYTRGLDGLGAAATIMGELIENYWDTLFPRKARMRGRVRALEWWLERTEGALKQLPRAPVPEEQLTRLRESLEKIEQLLRTRIEELPSFGSLYTFLNSANVVETPAHNDAQASDSRTTKDQATAGASANGGKQEQTSSSSPLATPEDAQRAFNQALEKLAVVSDFYRTHDLADPALYRLDRAIAWLKIDTLPQATDGRTRIPPPAQEIRILEELRAKGDNEAVLKMTGETLHRSLFWLDLNRFASEAMLSLGERFQAANETVRRDTAFFLHRLPGIEELAFSDGTPFADSETRQWLKEAALSSGSDGRETASPVQTGPALDEEEVIRKEVQEARTLIREKKLFEALDSMQQKIRQSASEKDRLLRRAAVSQLLIATKHAEFALPHLSQIVDDVDQYRLEEFDPPLAIKCLKIAWSGFVASSDQASRGKAVATLQRIARLDLGEAARLQKR